MEFSTRHSIARARRLAAPLLATLASLAPFAALPAARADGVAILKNQPYHKDRLAKAVIYQKLITSGPYLRIVTRTGNLDLGISKLAAHLEFPPPPPPLLMEPQQIAPFRSSLALMRTFASRYPASAPLLQPEIDVIAGYIDRFSHGDVRFEGKWIAREQIPLILAARRHHAEQLRTGEIEQVVADTTARDNGMVRVDGEWLTRQQAEQRKPYARTRISDALHPLIQPTLDGARKSIANLNRLAATQTGAEKVRTQRLATTIRNLFIAEYQLSRQMADTTVMNQKAAEHERHANTWSEPNAFGTKRDNQAEKSLETARLLRTTAARKLEQSRSNLIAKLKDADLVTADFNKLREYRATRSLAKTVRTIAERQFSPDEFTPEFPTREIAAINRKIRSAN